MFKKWFCHSLTLLILSACAQKLPLKEPHLMDSDVLVTEELRAGRYAEVYFSAQPQLKDWKALKDKGFNHVINLRTSGEYEHQEHLEEVEKQALNYTQVPMAKNERLTPRTLGLVTQALKEARKQDGKVLIHCGTQQRAAYWAGTHFYWDHGYSESEALSAAQALGLSSREWEGRLKEFMERYKKPSQI